MKARLEIENIGGLRGKQVFNFEQEKVNIIESPNATGKSSVIKGLAAVLSLPCGSNITIEEAVHLGLRATSMAELEPLINIYEDHAEVRLVLDGDERVCRFTKWKEPLIEPRGNEKFLFAGLLTRESRVVRYLAEGNDNFMWIVDTMSLARRYENARGRVEKALTEAVMKLDEIGNKSKELTRLTQEVERLEQERKRINREYEALEKELKLKPPEDPKLRALFEKLADEEREKTQTIKVLETEIKRSEQELMRPKIELYNIERELRSLEQERDKKLKDFKSLPSREQVKEWLDKADNLERYDIPNLREDRGKKVGVFNLIESALQVIGPSKKATCPLCGSTNVDADKLTLEKEKLKKEVAKLDRKLGELLIEIDRLRSETVKIGERREEYRKDISRIESEIHNKTSLKTSIEAKIAFPERKLKGKREELDLKKGELDRIRRELRQVERDIKKKEAERESLIIGRERLGEKLRNIDEELEKEKKNLEEKSWTIVSGSPFPFDRARKLYENWTRCLEAVIKDLDEKIREQRRGAARRFNSKIKELIGKLGFTEFDEIFLNEETYGLQVFRSGDRAQAISSLSSSERNAIATLLQLAVKEAYVPEVPFFIVDEMVLDFDRSRVEKILEYLSDLASQKAWFVVITRLVGEGPIKVSQLTR